MLQQERHQQRGLRFRQRTTLATKTIVEESNERSERAAARSEGSGEAAVNIASKAASCVEESLVPDSPQLSSLRREEVMEHLESTTWLGRVTALQGLLGLVSKMSLTMQTVNLIPWELMGEQHDFYNKIVAMREVLRDKPLESDPRWCSTPRDPIPALIKLTQAAG